MLRKILRSQIRFVGQSPAAIFLSCLKLSYIHTYFIIISLEGLFSDNANYKNYKEIKSVY